MKHKKQTSKLHNKTQSSKHITDKKHIVTDPIADFVKQKLNLTLFLSKYPVSY